MIRKLLSMSKKHKFRFSLEFNTDKDFDAFMEKGFFVWKTERSLPKEEINKLTKSIKIPSNEMEMNFCSSSGPGG